MAFVLLVLSVTVCVNEVILVRLVVLVPLVSTVLVLFIVVLSTLGLISTGIPSVITNNSVITNTDWSMMDLAIVYSTWSLVLELVNVIGVDNVVFVLASIIKQAIYDIPLNTAWSVYYLMMLL